MILHDQHIHSSYSEDSNEPLINYYKLAEELGKVEEILSEELKTAIVNLTEEQKEKLIVAYEPIWSIGTGVIPSNEEIKKTLEFIKTILPKSKILYGGSANENNIDILKQIEVIDGYLLGGLSLKPKDLEKFVKNMEILVLYAMKW